MLQRNNVWDLNVCVKKEDKNEIKKKLFQFVIRSKVETEKRERKKQRWKKRKERNPKIFRLILYLKNKFRKFLLMSLNLFFFILQANATFNSISLL